MDKVGMGWGGTFGAIWGFLYYTLEWPLSATIVEGIDKGVKAASGANLTAVVGGQVIMALICGTIGGLVGGMAGTGRKDV